MKFRDIIKQVERDGWQLSKTVGSHRQYKHPVKTGRVTIAGQPGKDTRKSILSKRVWSKVCVSTPSSTNAGATEAGVPTRLIYLV